MDEKPTTRKPITGWTVLLFFVVIVVAGAIAMGVTLFLTCDPNKPL